MTRAGLGGLALGLAVLSGTTLAVSPAGACGPEPQDGVAIRLIGDWLTGLQYRTPGLPSEGAIRVHHAAAFRDAAGREWFRVAPYNASLAVAGLLRTPVGGKLEIAAAWLRWYLLHVEADGRLRDHWYLLDGSGETTCPPGIHPDLCGREDSSDSYAATLLGLAWRYVEAGGDPAVLRTGRAALERLGELILGLQQADGLTWARADYRVKLLLNNAEVYWGLRGLARLERETLGAGAAGGRYDDAARRTREGIRKTLLDKTTGLYRLARFEDGTSVEPDLDIWYPDSVGLLWPHLFGVTGGTAGVAQVQMAAVNGSWAGTPNPDWTTTVVDPAGFLWPSAGRAALLAGDCVRARRHASFVRDRAVPGFEYPFTADDAGWLASLLADLQP